MSIFSNDHSAKARFDFRCAFSFRFLVALIFLASLSGTHAQVVTLTPTANNLYNTGYNGTVQAGNNQVDTHYTLTNYGPGQTYQANALAVGWVPNSSQSQWITVANTNGVRPSQTYDYKLVLTNIPVGSVVTIQGLVAADDNATISANSGGTTFSNFSPNVVAGNYGSFTSFGGVTFISSTTNQLNIFVSNNGGGQTGLNLQLSGSYVPLTSFRITAPNLTQNQTAVVDNINAINATGLLNNCFANLTVGLIGTNPTDLGAALDQLSPEKLGIFSSIAFNDATFRTQDLDDYLAHRRNAQGNLQVYPDKIDATGLTVNDPTVDPSLNQMRSHLLAWNPDPRTPGLLRDVAAPLAVLPPPALDPLDSLNFFVRGNVTLGQNLSQPELDHTDYTTSSFELGTDYQFGNHFLAGVLFDYGHTDTALDNQGSSATVDSYSPGLFASYADGGWFANALATFSHNAYTEQRIISIGDFQKTANGAPEGNQELGNLDGGYEFHLKQWTLGPTAGLQYTHLDINSFDENGACSADLNVKNQNADSLRSRIGGRVSYALLDRSDRVVFTPYLDASWQHEFLAGSRCITSSFRNLDGGDFIVSTPDTSSDSALVVLGLDADITHDMTLFTSYQAQAGASDYFGQSVQAGMKIAF